MQDYKFKIFSTPQYIDRGVGFKVICMGPTNFSSFSIIFILERLTCLYIFIYLVFCFLAYRKSYCDHFLSVGSRPSVKPFSFNDIFSETARPSALIFGMERSQVDFYQFLQIVTPGSETALQKGVLGSKIKTSWP